MAEGYDPVMFEEMPERVDPSQTLLSERTAQQAFNSHIFYINVECIPALDIFT
jgi:hypothetical protein